MIDQICASNFCAYTFLISRVVIGLENVNLSLATANHLEHGQTSVTTIGTRSGSQHTKNLSPTRFVRVRDTRYPNKERTIKVSPTAHSRRSLVTGLSNSCKNDAVHEVRELNIVDSSKL
jgi:hypothetical protein